ncbi:MAG: DUF1905 domain-containing protein [Myxococcales bacterium]|nr:DUF1905 domain-containing protein [Myxococcales bacterium]MCB9735862.1 DUF1905 domain-containing protein [Deltaproteobacteria bacterium]
MSEAFRARVVRGGEKDTMGIVVPDEVVARLGGGKRPPVVVSVGGHSWRSTVARMGGESLVGVAKEHRGPAGLTGEEDAVDVTLALDAAPRGVEPPADLAAALAAAGLEAAFGRLAPSAQKELVRQIETAKAAETRARRVDKAVEAARAKA